MGLDAAEKSKSLNRWSECKAVYQGNNKRAVLYDLTVILLHIIRVLVQLGILLKFNAIINIVNMADAHHKMTTLPNHHQLRPPCAARRSWRTGRESSCQ